MSEKGSKREVGFYWVKHEDKWIIAEWVEYVGDSFWLYYGFDLGQIRDDWFEEIDERRIVRND